MRTLAATAAVLATAVIVAGPAAGAARPGPAQITRAVKRAERSSSLWATINICNSRRYRNQLGVRGEMPTLGFRAVMTMAIQVNYWSADKRRFIPIPSPSALTTLKLGSPASGLQQDGAVFPFKTHTGRLNATITFTWTRGGKVIGTTHRRTTAGHHDADYGSPPRYSAAECTIP